MHLAVCLFDAPPPPPPPQKRLFHDTSRHIYFPLEKFTAHEKHTPRQTRWWSPPVASVSPSLSGWLGLRLPINSGRWPSASPAGGDLCPRAWLVQAWGREQTISLIREHCWDTVRVSLLHSHSAGDTVYCVDVCVCVSERGGEGKVCVVHVEDYVRRVRWQPGRAETMDDRWMGAKGRRSNCDSHNTWARGQTPSSRHSLTCAHIPPDTNFHLQGCQIKSSALSSQSVITLSSVTLIMCKILSCYQILNFSAQAESVFRLRTLTLWKLFTYLALPQRLKLITAVFAFLVLFA